MRQECCPDGLAHCIQLSHSPITPLHTKNNHKKNYSHNFSRGSCWAKFLRRYNSYLHFLLWNFHCVSQWWTRASSIVINLSRNPSEFLSIMATFNSDISGLVCCVSELVTVKQPSFFVHFRASSTFPTRDLYYRVNRILYTNS